MSTSIRQKQAVFSLMLGKLLQKSAELQTPVVILELYRSVETQKQYVARGLSKTMSSKHLYGLAVDLAFLNDIQDDGKINYPAEKYLPLGEYWESLGGRWGGRFGAKGKNLGWDSGHFEYAG